MNKMEIWGSKQILQQWTRARWGRDNERIDDQRAKYKKLDTFSTMYTKLLWDTIEGTDAIKAATKKKLSFTSFEDSQQQGSLTEEENIFFWGLYNSFACKCFVYPLDINYVLKAPQCEEIGIYQKSNLIYVIEEEQYGAFNMLNSFPFQVRIEFLIKRVTSPLVFLPLS